MSDYEEFAKRILTDIADAYRLDLTYDQLTAAFPRGADRAVPTSERTSDIFAEIELKLTDEINRMVTEKTYPPDIAIQREYLLAAVKAHLERVRKECEALPAHLASLRIDRAWRYELAYLFNQLLRYETSAVLRLIMDREFADRLQVQRKSPPA